MENTFGSQRKVFFSKGVRALPTTAKLFDLAAEGRMAELFKNSLIIHKSIDPD